MFLSINNSSSWSTSLFSTRRRLFTQKTFANQPHLPSLPIPTLHTTAERYKRSLLPLLSPIEYACACRNVETFVNGLGPILQRRLEAVAQEHGAQGRSWLDPLWLRTAYLDTRKPTLIHSNWWSQFQQDPPNGLAKTVQPGKTSNVQLQRAAYLAIALVHYSNAINNEMVQPETGRTGRPLCMQQLKNIFGATRIPARPCDKLMTTWPATAQHILVLFKDQLFTVPVFDTHDQVLSIKAMENQLFRVVDQVTHTPKEQLLPPVGFLTCDDRDTWADVRMSLMTNPTNAVALEAVDTALFALCLDDSHSPRDLDQTHRDMFHGKDGHNRWFDKSFQLIVENNGLAGINAEHSSADAIVQLNIFNYILRREADQAGEDTKIPRIARPPTRLIWDIDTELDRAIRKAQKSASKLIEDLDSLVLHYPSYGSDFIKAANMSPDSWMQMVFQLAYYRLYGRPCPTYEAASTRSFLTGRTEAVRSCSMESLVFTKEWEDKSVKMETKLETFKRAIGAHYEYMIAASNGMGVDRHFLGLRHQMHPGETTALFDKGSLFWRSQHWLLSASNTSPGDLLWGGFGPPAHAGYGVNYAVGPSKIRMSISSWDSMPETDSSEFRDTVRDILDEFGDVMQRHLVN